MKKITLLSFLLFSFFANAQTFAIYTEDPTIGAGLTNLRFSNGQGYAVSEPTTSPYQGTKNYLLTYNGTSSYFHGIFIPRNAANTGDITIDLSSYSYYNLAIKTSSPSPFYIRLRGNTIIAKVLINPVSNPYGFANDNQWHFMSIPLSDFIPEAATFSLTTITEAFVLRSNAVGSIVGTFNDIEVDNIYVSAAQVLTVNENSKLSINLYPNPATNSLTVNSSESIDLIQIFNVLGQKVLEINPNTTIENIDISSLSQGSYTVNIQSNKKTSTTRLIKK